MLAVGFGFGSSKTGIVGIEAVDGVRYVKLAEQLDRPGASNMLDRIARIHHRGGYTKCCIDASQPRLVSDLRTGAGGRKSVDIYPVVFREKLLDMAAASASAVKERTARIHPAFTELLSQLGTIQFVERGNPDKDRTSFDEGNALMMALLYTKAQDYTIYPVGEVSKGGAGTID